jgi:hypothetical protein
MEPSKEWAANRAPAGAGMMLESRIMSSGAVVRSGAVGGTRLLLWMPAARGPA